MRRRWPGAQGAAQAARSETKPQLPGGHGRGVPLRPLQLGVGEFVSRFELFIFIFYLQILAICRDEIKING